MAPLRQFFGYLQSSGEISAREWCRNQPSNSSIAALIRTSVTLDLLGDLLHRSNTPLPPAYVIRRFPINGSSEFNSAGPFVFNCPLPPSFLLTKHKRVDILPAREQHVMHGSAG